MSLDHIRLLIILLVAVCANSCTSKRKHAASDRNPIHYSLGVSTGGVGYAVAADHLDDGALDVKQNGTRVDATSMITSGKYMYFFNRAEKKFYQYELNTDGTVMPKSSLPVGAYVVDWAYSQNLIGDSTILVMDPVKWGDPEVKWLTIRIPDFQISGSGTFQLPSIEQSPGVKWKSNVGKGVVHAGKLIMGTVLYDFNGHFGTGTHVVTFDYPDMRNPQLVSTNLVSAELGIFSTNCFVTDTSGDLYVAACRGALWGVKTDSRVFGSVLRIRKGETRFDETYFLDLSKALGAPANILQLDYTGGHSAMAILFDDTRIKGWGDVANDHYYFAKIDLKSQKVLKYNVPLSDAHTAKRPLILNDRYVTYLKSTVGKSTQILHIDLKGNADAFRTGTILAGENIKGYSVTRHPSE